MESNLKSWQQFGLFGNYHGTVLANNSIRCNSILVLEASFVDKREPDGNLSPSLFGDFI